MTRARTLGLARGLAFVGVAAAFPFFVVLIAILVVRPEGLFGVRERTL